MKKADKEEISEETIIEEKNELTKEKKVSKKESKKTTKKAVNNNADEDSNNNSETTQEVIIEEKVEKDNNQKDKVMKILKDAKEKGNITYGQLAAELGDINPEEIEKVFDSFEELGVSILKDDDLLEPDEEQLNAVEEIQLEKIDVTNVEGVSVDDPVR